MKDNQSSQGETSTAQPEEEKTASVLSVQDEEKRRNWSTDNLQNLSVF